MSAADVNAYYSPGVNSISMYSIARSVFSRVFLRQPCILHTTLTYVVGFIFSLHVLKGLHCGLDACQECSVSYNIMFGFTTFYLEINNNSVIHWHVSNRMAIYVINHFGEKDFHKVCTYSHQIRTKI